MADNAQKTPIARALNQFAQKKIQDALQITGKALPCSVVEVSGSIVTVKFEVSTKDFTLPKVTVPIAGSEYARAPIQKGCKGVVYPADVNLGGVTGLGGGVATLAVPANLSALVFFPLGNKTWDAPESPNKYEIWGPDGVIVRSANKKARLDVTEDSSVVKYGDNASVTLSDTSLVLAFGTNNITIDVAGIHLNGPISGNVTGAAGVINFGSTKLQTSGDIETTAGEVKAGTIGLKSHHHTAQGATAPTTVSQA